MKSFRVGIAGAGGRMGRKLLEAVLSPALSLNPASKVTLGAAIEHADHMLLGTSAAALSGYPESESNVVLTDSFNPSDVDVFIDFSTPSAAVKLSRQCRKHNIAMVVGVTGFSEKEKEELDSASQDIPLLVSPNMSYTVLLMFKLVQEAAKQTRDYDAEISETHHRFKKDAPSGTALRLGEIVAEERHAKSFKDVAVYNREKRRSERHENEIGVSTIRGGSVVGEHRVIFAGIAGDQLEIMQRSNDRLVYAAGAMWAAMWLIKHQKPSGLYSMEDVAKDEFS